MKVRNPLPEAIGPYRITGQLGRGGMGEVLRAHDDRLGRAVALKRMHPDAREPEKALQRFRREAKAVGRLNHPAIVQVYDWLEHDGQHWLVMELIDGRSLDQVVARGPLPVEQALAVARDVASALAEAHGAGIVHRDLKTSNVILTQRGRAKVFDFGIAKLDVAEDSTAVRPQDSTLTAEGLVLGTVGSMSPEQALGRPVDHRSDLFSLGVLLYEMLSGVAPFEGQNTPEVLNSICNVQEEPLHQRDPQIPRKVSHLVAHLLEKEPARRPASAQEVVVEMDRMGEKAVQKTTRVDLEEVPVLESPPETSSSRHALPFPNLGLVVILGLALLGGAWWWWTSKDGQVPPASVTALPEPELTKTELYRRGVESLERSDRRADIEAAMHDFQAALALDPSFAPALSGLANAYRLDHYRGSRDPQRLEQALAAARQAVEFDEHLAVARVSLGEVLRSTRNFDEALQEFERALELEPANASALLGLGRIHGSRGDVEQAEAYLMRALEADPEEERFHSFLGGLYYRAGRYDEAEAAFLRHLESDPEAFTALSNLGATYYMQGKLSEAASQFQKALLIEPDPALYSNVGTIHFTQGLYAQSVTAFEKAIENGQANDPLLWGNLGDARRWTPGREQASREAYLRAIQLLEGQHKREDLTLRSRLALYRAKRGDCGQALAEAEGLEKQSGLNGSAFFRLAVTWEVCDRRELALEALKEALGERFSLEEIERDPELMDLRLDVRFHELVRDHQ